MSGPQCDELLGSQGEPIALVALQLERNARVSEGRIELVHDVGQLGAAYSRDAADSRRPLAVSFELEIAPAEQGGGVDTAETFLADGLAVTFIDLNDSEMGDREWMLAEGGGSLGYGCQRADDGLCHQGNPLRGPTLEIDLYANAEFNEEQSHVAIHEDGDPETSIESVPVGVESVLGVHRVGVALCSTTLYMELDGLRLIEGQVTGFQTPLLMPVITAATGESGARILVDDIRLHPP